MKTLRIGIAPYAEMKARTMAIARGELKPGRDDPKLWFTSIDSLARVLSDKCIDGLEWDRARLEQHLAGSFASRVEASLESGYDVAAMGG